MRIQFYLLTLSIVPIAANAAPIPVDPTAALKSPIEIRTTVSCNSSIATKEIPLLVKLCWKGTANDVLDFCKSQVPIPVNDDIKKQLPNSFLPEDVTILPEAAGLLECKSCSHRDPASGEVETSRCRFTLKNLIESDSPTGTEGFPVPNLLKITDWRLPPTRFRILDEDDPTTILEEYLSTFTYGGRTYELPSELDLDMIFASAALNPRPGQVNPNICFSDRVENGQRMCFFALGTYKLAEKTADLTCSAVDMQGLYCPVLNLLPSDRIAPLPHLPAPGGTFEIPGDDPEPVSEVKSALPTPNMVTATAPGFTTPYLVATIIPTGP